MGVIIKIIVNFLLGCGRPDQTAAFHRIGMVMGVRGMCAPLQCFLPRGFNDMNKDEFS